MVILTEQKCLHVPTYTTRIYLEGRWKISCLSPRANFGIFYMMKYVQKHKEQLNLSHKSNTKCHEVKKTATMFRRDLWGGTS